MINLLASSDEKESLGNKFREKRFQFFQSLIEPLIEEKRKSGTLPLTILDVGGTESYWVNMSYHLKPDISITLVNLMDIPSNHANILSTKGNATDLREYGTQTYDIVFSNSVIEHLYTLDAQQRMSNEVQRVGKKHFIQTPNKHFFIEAHYILPFFQYLPKKMQYPILTKTPLSRGRRWDKTFAAQYVAEIRLLSIPEMQKLFPKSQIYRERFLGMTKSITAHNFTI
jgi:hypothetical protein